ncbi:MAG: redoxin domain-containing protein [Acidobacteria bacterium]|nr:redoxin domain-containing protein [Acidobacteriota bacterium]
MSGKPAAFTVALLVAALGCTADKPLPPPATPSRAAGNFTRQADWIDLEGYRQRLAAERGRVVVVNFWATWCEPCREEFPDLIELDRRFRSRGLVFLSVSLDDPADRDTKVRDFLAELRPSFPVFIKSQGDPDPFINAIDLEWSGALPATFIYDRRGRRRHSLVGKQTLASLERHLEPLL